MIRLRGLLASFLSGVAVAFLLHTIAFLVFHLDYELRATVAVGGLFGLLGGVVMFDLALLSNLQKR